MKTKFPIWLISFLLRVRHASQEQILKEWSELINEEVTMHRNTFANYKRKAEDLFGIEIGFNRHSNEYFIEEEEKELLDDVYKWLIQSISASTVIARNNKLKHRIKLETTSGGEEWMDVITEAMEKSRCLQLTYQRFWCEPSDRMVEPYFIKLFNHRWYLIGRKRDSGEFRTYCLDRICSAKLTDESFIYRPDVEAESLFLDYYGILQEDVRKERVLLRVTCEQGMYIKTRPLHYSQTLLSEDTDYMDFELYLKPCYDFVQELLTYGPDLEVIEPSSLRKQMIESTLAMCKRYHI